MARKGYFAFCMNCVDGGNETIALAQETPLQVKISVLRKVLAMRREPCTRCGLPVFLAERLLVGRRLFHRPCFRCARCQHVLSLANCYETEDGEFCCETCPDEVGVGGTVAQDGDAYSTACESALEDPGPVLPPDTTPTPTRDATARSHFMSELVLASGAHTSNSSFELVSSDVKTDTQPFTLSSSTVEVKPNIQSMDNINDSVASSNFESSSKLDYSDRKSSDISSLETKCITSTTDMIQVSKFETGGDIVNDVPFKSSISKSSISDSQPITANSIPKDECSSIIAKPEDQSTKESDSAAKSLVKMRLRMFENNDTVGSTDKVKVSKTNSNRKFALYRIDTDEDVQDKTDDHSNKLKLVNTSESNKFEVYNNDVDRINTLQDRRQSFKSKEDSIERLGENICLKEECVLKSDELPIQSKFEEIGGKDNLSRQEKNEDEDKPPITQMLDSSVGQIVHSEKHAQSRDGVKPDILGMSSVDVNLPTEKTSGSDIQFSSSKESVFPTRKVRKSTENLNVCSFRSSSESVEKLEEVSFLRRLSESVEKLEEVSPLRRSSESVEKLEEERGSSKSVEKLEEFSPFRRSSESIEKLEKVSLPTNVSDSGEKLEEVSPSIKVTESMEKTDQVLVSKGEIDFEETLDQVSSSRRASKVMDATLYPEELNPFGDEDEDVQEVKSVDIATGVNPLQEVAIRTAKPPRPPLPSNRIQTLPSPRRVVEAPRLNLNPFWSDGEEPSSEEDTPVPPIPLPLPRTFKPTVPTPEPSPRPRKALDGHFGSVTSLSSVSPPGGSTARRKKKPAPPPPSVCEMFPVPTSSGSSRASSPSSSIGTPHHRKARPAPPPPTAPGKSEKDVANRSRQSQGPIPTAPNKSTFGQWKRKKGPAPPRPVPQRRQVTAMPMQEVRRELEDIEVQQQELERQGVSLEQTIRTKFDNTSQDDSSITPDVEDLVLQLFELVNEKNELFRRQAELMYLRRQQRLEEEHADLEYQIRCMLLRPEHSKSEGDRMREEELIQRLVEVVERRNEIVECLEMDRRREAEEDRSIHKQLGIFAAKGRATDEKSEQDSPKSLTKSGKKEKKSKKNKEKHTNKKGTKASIDVDKDIDEMESLSEHVKEKKVKKKWFL